MSRPPTSRDQLAQLHQLRDLAGEAAEGCATGDADALGVALNKSWEAKRAAGLRVSRTARSTRPSTRRCDAGATGAKVTGAGGGGFVLVVCPVEHQAAVREPLWRR